MSYGPLLNSAMQGDTETQYILAMYFNGWAVRRDTTKMVELLPQQTKVTGGVAQLGNIILCWPTPCTS